MHADQGKQNSYLHQIACKYWHFHGRRAALLGSGVAFLKARTRGTYITAALKPGTGSDGNRAGYF
jgi:hypothetical protein